MKDNSYSLGIPSPFPENFEGTAIVLHKIENIPPHVALLHNGMYYSLSVKGAKVDIPFAQFYEEVQRLKKSCVLIEIHVPFYIPSPVGEFDSLPPLSSQNFITCLTPIKEWLVNGMDEEVSEQLIEAEFVFNLIEVLQREGSVEQVYAAFVNDGELKLPTYTWQDIMDEISRKEKKHANG